MINTFGSLFSGAGGLDLGLERAGLECVFQVENDRNCLTILTRHWPNVPKNEIRSCMGLVGGDPCPIRSSLKGSRGTSKPDMSGYFLAMAARCKPGWILRENVLAPDVVEFSAALTVLGYRTAIVGMDSKAFTGQGRKRQFVVGFREESTAKRFESLLTKFVNTDSDPMLSKEQKATQCLNARGRSGVSIYQDFIYEGSARGLRSHTHAERETLQGWPIGWTGGISHSGRERMTGNGVTADVAEWLGKIIKETLEKE